MPRESYVHGNSGPPLIGKTIGALLDEVSATDGSREALVVAHQEIRWTYSELKMRSDAFASGLLALGLEPGIASASGPQTARNGRSHSLRRRRPA